MKELKKNTFSFLISFASKVVNTKSEKNSSSIKKSAQATISSSFKKSGKIIAFALHPLSKELGGD